MKNNEFRGKMVEQIKFNKKLLLITPYNKKNVKFLKGGIGTWSVLFVNKLLENNINFKVVDMSPIGKRLKKLNQKPNPIAESIRATKIIFSALSSSLFYRPNVVHLNSSGSYLGFKRDLITLRLFNKKRTRLVLQLHCDVKKVIGESKKKAKMLIKVMNRADLVLTLNEESLLFCKSLLSNKEMEIIPNFISSEMVRKDPKIVSDRINKVLFVGYNQRKKGFYEIIETAKHFPEKEFILVGNRRDETKSTKIGDNVKIIEDAAREDVFKYLGEADIFLFPSYSEGFSIALLEAMSMGLPIICTDVGANKMMVRNGGIIVETQNVEQIVAAINEMESKDLRQKMSTINVNTVNNEYTIEKVYNKLIDFYNS